jgi:hypothetical protein
MTTGGSDMGRMDDGGTTSYAHSGNGGTGGEQVRTSHGSIDKGDLSSIGALISDISTDLSTLIRKEMELAKAEARESATKAGKGAGLLGGAGVAGHLALLFLSVAAWWGLGSLMDNRGWAAVIVAVVWAIVAAVLASMGRKSMKEISGVPRTMETAKQVPGALKGNGDRA